MTAALRVLFVEDVEADAKLMTRLLAASFTVDAERVQDAAGLAAALDGAAWDVVICDFSLPGFDAFGALDVFAQRHVDAPFIVASGSIGEEQAAALIRAGAHDVVLKDRLFRLVAVVERELKSRDERRVHAAAARALEESRVRLSRLSEAGVLGIMVASDGGAILEANDTVLEMLGYTRDDLLAGRLDWRAMTPPECVEASDDIALQLATSGRAKPVEKEYIRKDGTRVPVLLAFAGLDSGRNVCVVSDLSAQRRAQSAQREAEDRLRQAQKLDAIGSLAGGVAHDFNNMLSIILSYTELLLEDLRPGDPMRGDIEQIREAGKRAADLTRQLLAFSRKQVLSPQIVDVNAVVRGVKKMLRRLIGEDVQLRFLPDAALGSVRVDPGQLEQVVVNLVVNARDAITGGGRVTIETSNVDLDEAYASAHGTTAGPHVLIAVSDTGAGMDAATRERMFEPFFTTKAPGKGTGLGLSTVFGIVKQSGGSVWAYSELGVGTTMKVYLPRTDAVGAPRPSVAARRRLGAGERVLIVEDEPAVRRVAAAVLERLGYRVLIADGPEDALRQVREEVPVDLVLTDVVMPGTSGPDLAALLREARPGLRVLFMSGYADRGIVTHGVLESGALFLQKPFTLETFAERVGEALSAPPSGEVDGAS